MTIFRGTLQTPDRTALVGWVDITVDRPVPTGDLVAGAKAVVMPTTSRETLVNGFFSADLEPTILSKAVYTIEVFQDLGSGRFSSLRRFENVTIPDQAVYEYEELASTTGIYRDTQDSRFTTIAQRVYADPGFWATLLGQVFNRRGDYSSVALYSRGDLVEYDGAGWMWTWPENGNELPVYALSPQGYPISGSDKWSLLGARGQTGTGTSGNNTPFGPGWDNQLDAPSRNAVFDALQTYATQAALSTYAPLNQPSLQQAMTDMGADAANLALSSNRVPNAAWVQSVLNQWRLGFNPIGTVVAYCGTVAPQGWLFCEGQIVSRTTYAALFTILGTQFNTGGESASQFRLPDLRGRLPVHMDSGSIRWSGATANGLTGGSQTHVLTEANLPPHSHGTPSGLGYMERASLTATSDFQPTVTTPGQARWATNTANGNGTSAPVSHLPPFLTVRYIIYAGV